MADTPIMVTRALDRFIKRRSAQLARGEGNNVSHSVRRVARSGQFSDPEETQEKVENLIELFIRIPAWTAGT